jgi:hypothetical protein
MESRVFWFFFQKGTQLLLWKVVRKRAQRKEAENFVHFSCAGGLFAGQFRRCVNCATLLWTAAKGRGADWKRP